MPQRAQDLPSVPTRRAPDWVLENGAYLAFLTNLQAHVRAGNRRGVIALVSFPLRVNGAGGVRRVYRDAGALARDYDWVFSIRVRQAILAQRFGELFGRDQGVMIGDGEVWFDHTCRNENCLPKGPVRIRAINR